MATLKEVAKAAKVSTVTASSVLSGADRVRVSEKTSRRIHKVAHKMNYVPLASARGLRTGKLMSIGFVAAPQRVGRWNGQWQEMLRGVNDMLWDREEHLILSLPKDQEYELAIIRKLAFGRQVDGLILQSYTSNDPRIDLLRQADIPFVMIGSAAAGTTHTVAFDLHRFASLLTGQILSDTDGIAVIAPPSDNESVREILAACKQFADQRNVFHQQWTGSFLPPPEWFLCCKDECDTFTVLLMRQLLPELIAILEQTSLRLGRDINVTYLADGEEILLPVKGIEIINLDYYTLGRRAAQLLFRMINNEEVKSIMILPAPAEGWTTK